MGILPSKIDRSSVTFQSELAFEGSLDVQFPSILDNAERSFSFDEKDWVHCKFKLQGSTLECSASGEMIETVLLDKNFEVLNEQGNSLIFTVKFVTKDNTSQQWKLRASSADEFLKWTSFVKQSLRAEWSLKDSCECCKSKFGVFTRRHHCRACGRSVCSDCSPIMTTLPHLGYSALVRVCKTCGDMLAHKRKGPQEGNSPNYTQSKRGNSPTKQNKAKTNYK
ncbi:unnamed protein product [Blepharisma stoltei]|uniref:FYVE-type domain-containing protein n=1 Tax=Blepharisma stoltei TaxID=1481888 RepID=A0AAU9JJ90_9CILI|nr:unnamed protein product [Blepharisma stoltei]